MNRQDSISRSDLESMLFDETAAPKALPLSLLKEITNGFSDEQEIGRGGFAVVYKGMLENGMVAVKRLSNTHMHEKEFHREVECLMNVKHKNVVRFLGYCADTQGNMERYNGRFVMADVQQRLLCFEYLPKGSLHDYITNASNGLQWRDRYQIIRGICEGLHYLHQKNIVHLDLKPANILLDDNMVPKIADFGLSRCFEEKQSWAITTRIGGTLGYLAPEFGSRVITHKFDLYSFGVIIIEILTGAKGYHAVENVTESWRNRLNESQGDTLISFSDTGKEHLPETETELEQVKACAEIGIACTEFNPAKRPVSTQHIIDRLRQMEYSAYNLQPRHIVERMDADLWKKVLDPGNVHRKQLIDEVITSILPESNSPEEISAAVIAFMQADLALELFQLLENIILRETTFSGNSHLQNLFVMMAIKADRTRLMDLIDKLDNFDGHAVGEVAVEAELFEEAFAMFRKFGFNVRAIKVLLDNIQSVARAEEFARQVDDEAVWSEFSATIFDAS